MADAENQAELEHLRYTLESRRQMRQATLDFEHAGLKTLLLLNGGGLIAFLAFLGTDAGQHLEPRWTTASLIAWLIGLVLAGFATGFAYRSQYQFYREQGNDPIVQARLKKYSLDERLSDDELRNKAQR